MIMKCHQAAPRESRGDDTAERRVNLGLMFVERKDFLLCACRASEKPLNLYLHSDSIVSHSERLLAFFL